MRLCVLANLCVLMSLVQLPIFWHAKSKQNTIGTNSYIYFVKKYDIWKIFWLFFKLCKQQQYIENNTWGNPYHMPYHQETPISTRGPQARGLILVEGDTACDMDFSTCNIHFIIWSTAKGRLNGDYGQIFLLAKFGFDQIFFQKDNPDNSGHFRIVSLFFRNIMIVGNDW